MKPFLILNCESTSSIIFDGNGSSGIPLLKEVGENGNEA